MTSAVPVGGDHQLRRALPAATRGGLLAAAAAVALGQIPPLVMNLSGAGLAVVTQLRLGWLYTAASTGASIVVEGGTAGDDGLVEVATIRVVVLSITVVTLWLAVRAGRAVAGRVRDDPRRRMLAGALVGPAFAVPMWALASLVSLRLETGGILPEVSVVAAVPWQVAVGAVAIGGVGGAIGGLTAGAAEPGGWVAVVAGGSLALGWALVLSLVGVLLFAAVRPSGLEGYVSQLRSLDGEDAALVLGHQALLAPNQAIAVLVPTLGGCDVVSTGGRSTRVLCLGVVPVADSPLDALAGALAVEALETRPMPGVAWAFVLVPIVSIAIGARRASRGARTAGAAALRGAGVGIVFATLVAVAIFAATASVSTRGVLVDRLTQVGEAGAISVGPQLGRGVLLALAWGVGVGSVAGFAIRRFAGGRRLNRRD